MRFCISKPLQACNHKRTQIAQDQIISWHSSYSSRVQGPCCDQVCRQYFFSIMQALKVFYFMIWFRSSHALIICNFIKLVGPLTFQVQKTSTWSAHGFWLFLLHSTGTNESQNCLLKPNSFVAITCLTYVWNANWSRLEHISRAASLDGSQTAPHIVNIYKCQLYDLLPFK